MIEKDVVIIGAGPSGLFAGINIDGRKLDTVILEKNPSAGKKLLISGGGQCNLTHQGKVRDFFDKYGDKGKYLKNTLYNFTNKDLVGFFKTRGLDMELEENGKIFPKTRKAEDILNILLKELNKNNVEIKYNSNVLEVEYIEDKEKFLVTTLNNKYICRYLVITSGGKSYPNTGSTGDGFTIAEKFGHKIVKPKPALTPIYVKDYSFKNLSGISIKVGLSLWRDNKKINETTGDMLFTHINLSGPVVLNFSRYVNSGDILKINFLPDKNKEVFKKEVINILQNYGSKYIKTFISDLNIPNRLGEKNIEISGIKKDKICAEITKEQREKLIENLTEMNLIVDKLGDYHLAMVTSGGVDLSQINRKTMESKIIKNLYFAGEVLDIDGDTGGYNIQWAFSSGYTAAKSIG
ncbi:MAG: NAD(P)/FAD-dependent oxidoreductase [Bacillota bacterium]|nr:NAD(P)/FAD-dependent oxidoreductase [Bacillota bacterium]